MPAAVPGLGGRAFEMTQGYWLREHVPPDSCLSFNFCQEGILNFYVVTFIIFFLYDSLVFVTFLERLFCQVKVIYIYIYKVGSALAVQSTVRGLNS